MTLPGYPRICHRYRMLSFLARAMREDRVVITCDKSDYGSLIYQYGHPAQCGVVLFRFRDLPGAAQAQFIANTLANDAIDWRGSFTVIRTRAGAGRIRFRLNADPAGGIIANPIPTQGAYPMARLSDVHPRSTRP